MRTVILEKEEIDKKLKRMASQIVERNVGEKSIRCSRRWRCGTAGYPPALPQRRPAWRGRPHVLLIIIYT